ncbi:MAG: signal peptidase II [Oscillospiraceae bacterium]|nr:signal peptidase II [Oscillospiraceae bacterium]
MLYAIVAIIALIIDQAVKYWTTTHIVLMTGTKKFIPGFIYLTNYHNEGAAFSMLSGARWLFVALCIIFVGVVIYVLATDIIKGKIARWSAVMVLAGAVGNCIDRILNGYVVDMFVFEFVDFAVFNVADIYITCGAIVFCLCVLLDKSELSTVKKPSKGKVAVADGEADFAAVEENAAPSKLAFVKDLLKKPSSNSGKIAAPRSHTAPVAAPVEIDPNDPFAEWEKRAGVARSARAASEEHAASNPFADVQPAAPAVPTAPAVPASAPTASAESAAPVMPSAPVAPAAPKAPAADDFNFSLDDILAEFKD